MTHRAHIRIVETRSAEDIQAARDLFTEYALSLGWDLEADHGHFAAEIRELPGPYSPPAGSLLLACVDDVPAGALGLQPVPEQARIEGIGAERFGELKRLYVRPQFRRLGIGRALLRRAEDEARARGYDRLVLTTSAEMMPLAQGLYESLGYREMQPYRNDMPYPQIRWMELLIG